MSVYYDPANPEMAVPEPRNRSGVAAPLWASLFLIFVGAVLLFAFTRV